jgi:multisubunit Na+/H+ antiporter MnhG subunit
MSGSAHGHTTAAWTGVGICFIGCMVSAVFMVVGPKPVLVIVGLVIAVVGPIIGKILSAAGYGKKADSTPSLAAELKKTPVGSGVSS